MAAATPSSLLSSRTGTCQSYRSFNSLSNAESAKLGLFSLPDLHTPSDFMKLAKQAMAKSDNLRSDLQNQQLDPSSIHSIQQASVILFQLDTISREVCNVIDAAELCRSTHSDAAWREAASGSFVLLSDYIAQLNGDTALYQSVTAVIQSSLFSDLTEEQQHFAIALQAEFERDGIHLPDAEREEVRKKQEVISKLEMLFQENIIKSQRYFNVESSWVGAILPKQLVEEQIPQSPSKAANEITLSTSQGGLSSTLLRYSPQPELRKQIHWETSTVCPENLQVLDALRQARHEAALQQGFTSYAERYLRDKMVQNQANVKSFLDQVQNTLRPRFRADMEIIQQAKKQVEQVVDPQVEAWDTLFYSHILKAKDGLDMRLISEHFTVEGCVSALQTLVHSLFGIHVEEKIMAEGESWDDRVRKFVFETEDGQSLGTLYLDLFPRVGKYGHAAHFTVRCGCVLRPDSLESEDDYQRPIVALVCNFQPPEVQPIMGHSEVETFFHEMGHALHSLLSRTTFQHVSGTRVPMDFVETPSQLLENYAWNGPFIKNHLARHYQTGEPIPDDALRRLLQSRHELASINMMQQVVYSKFDQEIFGGDPSKALPTTQLFQQLMESHGLPFVEGTHWHSTFGHLVSYGAGYYGYLFSEVFADDIWQHGNFDNEPFNRHAGMQLWKQVLEKGGSRDPNAMLQDLLGRPPKVVLSGLDL